MSPSSTPERRAEWKDDDTAIAYLEGRGFVLGPDWCWTPPVGVTPSHRDREAAWFLIEEYDFGGIRTAAIGKEEA